MRRLQSNIAVNFGSSGLKRSKPRRCQRGLMIHFVTRADCSGAHETFLVIRVKSRSTGTAVSSLKRHLNVRSGRFKSRPPHALIESRLNYYCQISFDWTTSFLSDNFILRCGREPVKNFTHCFKFQPNRKTA